MKTPIALLTAAGLLAVSSLHAEDQPAPATDQAKPGRTISLVLLLKEPRTLDTAALATAVSHAWGKEVPESTISSRPPSFVIKCEDGKFAINSVDKPYFVECAKLASEVKDLPLSEAIRDHKAWISVDWLDRDENADLRIVYQKIGKIIVELVRKDTLAVYSPETDQFHLNDETLLGHLKSEDPLQSLSAAHPADADKPLTIAEDDPKLLAAQAEAQKNWPEFAKAFNARTKDQYFAVKGPVVEDDTSEYVWLQITDIDDKQVHGKLDSDPAALTKVKRGADLHIPIAEVNDWLYSTGNERETRGGYTLRLLEELIQAEQKN